MSSSTIYIRMAGRQADLQDPVLRITRPHWAMSRVKGFTRWIPMRLDPKSIACPVGTKHLQHTTSFLVDSWGRPYWAGVGLGFTRPLPADGGRGIGGREGGPPPRAAKKPWGGAVRLIPREGLECHFASLDGVPRRHHEKVAFR